MINNYNSFHSDPVLAGRTATAKQTFKKEMSAKLHVTSSPTHFVEHSA